MGEERMAEAEEEEEEGYLTLTDLGERLPILEGCTNVCFTIRRRECLREERGGTRVFPTLGDICTKFPDKYRRPFSHSPLPFS